MTRTLNTRLRRKAFAALKAIECGGDIPVEGELGLASALNREEEIVRESIRVVQGRIAMDSTTALLRRVQASLEEGCDQYQAEIEFAAASQELRSRRRLELACGLSFAGGVA